MTNELEFIKEILRASGALVMRSFGARIATKRKAERSQVVTAVDVASERLLITAIEKRYPGSSIIAEESGFIEKNNEDVWIIDPIDGTSNFANGLPWFGVMVAHTLEGKAVSSGVYLPVSDELYVATVEKGLWKNGKKIVGHFQDDLSSSLIAFGTDGSPTSMSLQRKANIFRNILPHILNFRSTNSIVDYCYLAEGKLVGALTLESRIWDVAPVIPIAEEGGCVVTDIEGKSIDITVAPKNISQNYTLLVASEKLHPQLLKLIREASS